MLGAGAFGITYRAVDTHLDRQVAIKEYLPIDYALRQADGSVRPRSSKLEARFKWGHDRFLLEAKNLARFDKAPGIVRVYDYVKANGTAYMVMEWVRGETLEVRLNRLGRLPMPVIGRFLPHLLDGLERVHAEGFLHRDIKPANILIGEADVATLVDFGASRFALHTSARALTAIQTPGYAPFEQSTSEPQGPWTDIYALGATLYHCVTGRIPPSANDRMMRDTLAPAAEIGKGHYSPALLTAIDAAMKLDAGDRLQSIQDFRRELANESLRWQVADPPREASPARLSRSQPLPSDKRGGWRARAAFWLPLMLAAGAINAWHWAEDSAQREDNETWRQCRGDDAAIAIKACTALFESTRQPEIKRAIAANNRGVAYGRLQQNDRAILEYETAVRLGLNKSFVFANLGLVYARKNNHDRAVQEFDKSLALDEPDNAQTLYRRGMSLRQLSKWDAAIADFNRVAKMDPKFHGTFIERGAAYYEKKEPALAVADLDRAIALSSDDVFALNWRGYIHMKQDRCDPAINDLSRVLALDARNADALQNRAWCLNYRLKKYDLAIQDYDRLLEVKPALEIAVRGREAAVAAKEREAKAASTNTQAGQ